MNDLLPKPRKRPIQVLGLGMGPAPGEGGFRTMDAPGRPGPETVAEAGRLPMTERDCEASSASPAAAAPPRGPHAPADQAGTGRHGAGDNAGRPARPSGRSRAGLPAELLEVIDKADVLAGGRRVLDLFADHPGGRVLIGSPLGKCLDELAAAREQGLKVVVLAGGDPLFFGIGQTLLARFGAEALRFHPAPCAVAAACARLGLPWHDLPAVSLHGRSDPAPLLAALTRAGRAAVYTDHRNTPAALAGLLLERGLEGASLTVLEDMGLPGERVRRLTPAQALDMECSPLNLTLIDVTPGPGAPATAGSGHSGPRASGQSSQSRARPRLGRPDAFYAARAGLITKRPVRAAALAALELPDTGVLWDVGAGSGAVAVEACALLREGLVCAVERDPERAAMIRHNVRRAGAWQCLAVEGEAPGVLEGLPDPDRVFLGGSLSGGTSALAACMERLKPGGRLVAATVLLGSFQAALERMQASGWPVEVWQFLASRAEPLAGDLRFVPQNPVFLLAADKPLGVQIGKVDETADNAPETC